MNCLFRKLNTNFLNYVIVKSQFKQFSNKTLRQLINIENESSIKNQLTNEWQTIRRITTSTQINLLKINENISIQKRYKKGKKGAKQQKKEESSDDESDEELSQSAEEDPDLIDGKAIDFVDVNTTIMSLRLDNVAKGGLNMARNKVEESFYNNLLRINGERVAKKSVELAINDELDYIKGLNADNPDLIDVSRVVLKHVEDKMSTSGRYKVKFRRFPRLTIKNYDNDPYDGLAMSPSRSE